MSRASCGLSGVVDVAEVDGFEELCRLHVGEELPERLAFGAGVEVPDGVDEGTGGEVDDAFFGAEPAELGVVGELAGEGAEVVGDGAEGAVDDVAGEIADGLDDEVGAAAEGEGEAVAFEAGVGLEDAVGGGVVGIFVDGVGADLLAGGGEAQVDDADAGDKDFVQVGGFPFVSECNLMSSCCGPAAVDGDDGAVDELGFAGAEIADE